jgi:hypothetical protein
MNFYFFSEWKEKEVVASLSLSIGSWGGGGGGGGAIHGTYRPDHP